MLSSAVFLKKTAPCTPSHFSRKFLIRSGAHPEARVLALPNLEYTSARRTAATPHAALYGPMSGNRPRTLPHPQEQSRALQRFRKWYIPIRASQVGATPRSDDPELHFDRTRYFRNRSNSASVSRLPGAVALPRLRPDHPVAPRAESRTLQAFRGRDGRFRRSPASPYHPCPGPSPC